jgi:hypothetical protein
MAGNRRLCSIARLTVSLADRGPAVERRKRRRAGKLCSPAADGSAG